MKWIERLIAWMDRIRPERYVWTCSIVVVAGFLVGMVSTAGCQPVPPIENAAAVAQYEGLLEHCRQRGKVAGSFAVYEACADAVDRELCNTRGLRCKDGGAP
jgi:hypothetical protein